MVTDLLLFLMYYYLIFIFFNPIIYLNKAACVAVTHLCITPYVLTLYFLSVPLGRVR